MKETRKKSSLTLFTVILLVFLAIYVVTLVAPFLWALLTSLKEQRDFRLNIIGLPKEWAWANYPYVFENFSVLVDTESGQKFVGMAEQFLYAFLYSFGCAFTNTLVPCLTAYLCARFPYKLSKWVYTTVIVVMTLPIVGSLPAEVQMAKTLGLYDSVWGLWVMKANFLGMYFLMFYTVYKNMPMAYTEAACIDGAGNMSVLIRIILPLSRNTFFTVMLINFITFWNDYQTPLIYMPSKPTVAYGMFVIANATTPGLSTIPMRMAGAMLMLIPILIVFLCFHKRLIGNLTVGGIKG